jgi:hypothetical protein
VPLRLALIVRLYLPEAEVFVLATFFQVVPEATCSCTVRSFRTETRGATLPLIVIFLPTLIVFAFALAVTVKG